VTGSHAEYMASLPAAQAERIREAARSAAAEAPPLSNDQTAALSRILAGPAQRLRDERANPAAGLNEPAA
jgi:phytoene/squalene synthetase